MEYFDNKTPQYEVENIRTTILTDTETNMPELFEVDEYVSIFPNEQFQTILYC